MIDRYDDDEDDLEDDDPEPYEGPELGPCCICMKEGQTVRNIMMLDRKAPSAGKGKGWGCLECHLPADGAMAVLCDACLEDFSPQKLQWIVVGYPKDRVRVRPTSYPYEPFYHDNRYHPEEWRWFKDSPDTGTPECLCSVCGLMIPQEDDVIIRMFNTEDNTEVRFHRRCTPPQLGIQFGPREDVDEP